jgi:hypothetical protein
MGPTAAIAIRRQQGAPISFPAAFCGRCAECLHRQNDQLTLTRASSLKSCWASVAVIGALNKWPWPCSQPVWSKELDVERSRNVSSQISR